MFLKRIPGWLWALTTLAVVAALGLWALLAGEPTSRRVMARSIRAAVGPPGALEQGDPGTGPRPTTEPAPDAGTVPPEPPKHLRDVSFVLLLGMDRTRGRITGRTDAMIVLAFRHADSQVAAFSIPRDLWIEIPDHGPARINSVVRIGNLRLGDGQGVPLLRRVIDRELGIRIDQFAAVDFEGFVKLVDRLGGVDVDVQCPIVDCFWEDGTGEPCEMMKIEAGRRHMSGRTALKFVRSRHGRGDRDRTRRQQAVLVGLERRVRREGLGGLRELWSEVEPHVETDLDWKAAAYYGSFALEVGPRDVRGFSIRKPITSRHVTAEKKHVLLLDRGELDAALERMFDAPMPGIRPRRRCPAADAALTFRDR